MASIDMSAAAARSVPLIPPDSPPLRNVPPANSNQSQTDARKVTPKGLHVLCPFCPPSDTPKYFVRSDHFHAHVRVEHPGEKIPAPDGYTCPCHGRPFASRWEMERHARGQLRIPCKFCGRPLVRGSMQRHLLTCRHTGGAVKKHNCTRCKRQFASALGTNTRPHSAAPAKARAKVYPDTQNMFIGYRAAALFRKSPQNDGAIARGGRLHPKPTKTIAKY